MENKKFDQEYVADTLELIAALYNQHEDKNSDLVAALKELRGYVESL